MKTINNILKYPLMMFTLIGRHPEQNSKTRFVSAIFYLTSLTFLSLEIVIQMISYEGDINKLVNHIETCAGYLQVGVKVIFTITHRNDIIRLINELKPYIKSNSCDLSITPETEKIQTDTERLMKILGASAAVVLPFILIAPYFTKELPFGTWTLSNHDTLFKATMIVQEITFPFYIALICSVDALFVALSICLIIKFQILSSSLKNLHSAGICYNIVKESYFGLLKEYIQYHIFLRSYASKLSKTIAPMTMTIYISSVTLVCIELDVLIGNNNRQIIRRLIAIVYLFIQLALYCIPADYITREALAVSNTLYESDWAWTTVYFPGSQREIRMIMLQSLKPIVFTAGGLTEVNRTTLIFMLKILWFFFTVIKAAKNA